MHAPHFIFYAMVHVIIHAIESFFLFERDGDRKELGGSGKIGQVILLV